MKPFVAKELSKPNLFDKIANKEPEYNLAIEVNNRLSLLKFENLPSTNINDLLEKYKVKKPNKNITKSLLDLLICFLDYHLGNLESTYNDYSSAIVIQNLLSLDDEDFKNTYTQVAESKTKKLILDMLIDNNISDQEEKILDEWKAKLNLSDNQVSDIFQPIGQEIANKYIAQITADGKISPEEETSLTNLITGLKSNMVIDEKSQIAIDRMKLMWRIENDQLDPIPLQIMLPKTEICYFASNAELYETRKVTKSVSYGGPSIRMKILKGVYYRAGNLGFRPHSEDELTLIDSGKLYITNKRLLFVGSKQNKPIQLNKIIDFTVYRNGLEVLKDSGKSPFYKMVSNADLAGAYLSRCLNDLLN